MNWFDILAILLVFCFGYVGFLRGFLGVLFDLIALVAGTAIACAFSSNLAWAVAPKGGVIFDTVSVITWILVFAGISSGLLYLSQKMNEPAEKGTPVFLWRGLGTMLGLIEGVMVLFFLFFMMGQTELHRAVTVTFKNSSTVTSVQSLNPIAEGLYTGLSNSRSLPRIRANFKNSVFRNKKI